MKSTLRFFTYLLIILFMSTAPLLSHAEKSGSNEMISFNFVDVEIPTVVKFISALTGDNFIYDERIKGNITIIAPTKLNVSESFSLFTSVLSLKGYTIVPAGPKTYKIIPSSMAKQSGVITPESEQAINEAYVTKLIPTHHIKAEDTLQFLRPVISRDGHISVFGPRNLLLVVDSAMNIEKIMSILKKIDHPSVSEEEAVINVFFLEHADATTLSKVLQGVIKDLQAAYKKSTKTKKSKTSKTPPLLNITPDKATNSLVVVAPPSEYEKIVSVIRTLDKKRKQVFVEAMIVEASIDKLKQLGTKWRATATDGDNPAAIGGFGNVDTGTMQQIMTGITGFSMGGMGNFLTVPVSTISSDGTISTENLTAPGFAALFSLNYFEDAINVLSTPQILTSDNEEAEIVVGENVPFISKTQLATATNDTIMNSIERKNVGITLRITPQISEGEHVKLDIFQEISAVKDTTESILTSVGPTTTTRSTKTSVVVKDGHTIVIGGLIQEEERSSTAKTPFFGDIPIIGWLFKSKTIDKDKKNLLIFLSPHIVKETPALKKLTEEKHRQFIQEEKFYRKGELMVKFKEDVPIERALEIISGKQAAVLKYFDNIYTYHIKLKPKQEVEEAMEEFMALPEVLFVEPNYKIKLNEGRRRPN